MADRWEWFPLFSLLELLIILRSICRQFLLLVFFSAVEAVPQPLSAAHSTSRCLGSTLLKDHLIIATFLWPTHKLLKLVSDLKTFQIPPPHSALCSDDNLFNRWWKVLSWSCLEAKHLSKHWTSLFGNQSIFYHVMGYLYNAHTAFSKAQDCS